MPATKNETTPVATWTVDLTPSAIEGATKKAEAAAEAIKRGDEFYLKAAHRIEEAYRLYLKGDRKRLEAFCSTPPLNLKGSMGYEYVKAARADKAFGDTIKEALPDADIGVRGLAMLARFTGSEDAEAEGTAIIEAEVKAAKAEGRKPLSVEALQKAVTSNTEATPDREATRIARIVKKYEALYAASYNRFTEALEKGLTFSAFTDLAREFGQYGAEAGAAFPLACDTMRRDLKENLEKALKEAARQEREEAAEAARYAASAAMIRPPAPKPAPTVKAEAPKPKPRRMNRKPRSIGLAAKVAADAPADGS